jgi:hypothetical protein
MLGSRRTGAIPTAHPEQFGPVARRTRLVRAVLGISLVALVGASIALARGLHVKQAALLPRGTTGVVVLDFSTSIEPRSYRRIGSVLNELIAADASVALVIFSDVSYELLPPGTPARELKPLLRFIAPQGSTLPENPWTSSFRGGTRISTGLELAREMLKRDRVRNGTVLLVSDLETASSDISALTRVLTGYESSGIPLRIVALAPLRDDRFFFQSIVGKDAFVEPLAPARAADASREVRVTGSRPRWLLIAASLLVLLLAANEHWCGRLVVPGRTGA